MGVRVRAASEELCTALDIVNDAAVVHKRGVSGKSWLEVFGALLINGRSGGTISSRRCQDDVRC
jgi:hypothetical protein